MSENDSTGGLHIDADWKTEAAQEKERLATKERLEQKTAGAQAAGPAPSAGFIELVNILVMQIAVALGGMQDAGGARIPPNFAHAKHLIDLLEVLDQKTRGNLAPEEKRMLDTALYELRLQYVQVVSKPPPTESPKE